jgi:hypothetical protein
MATPTAGAIDTQAYMPWAEATAATYTSTRTAGDATATLPAGGWCRYTLGEVEAAVSNGVYLRTDETVTFALDALPWEPKPRDTLAPAGLSARVVLDVSPYRFLKFWSVKVRDLVLAYDLRDTCTVRRSNPAPDDAGRRDRNPTDPHAGVPCRLQPLDAETDLAGDRVDQRRRYACFLGQALTLDPGDTLVVGGVEYEATGQSEIDRFDTLTRVACERVR